jgi:CubicO group peptidase (beta-lactamase class C family)
VTPGRERLTRDVGWRAAPPRRLPAVAARILPGGRPVPDFESELGALVSETGSRVSSGSTKTTGLSSRARTVAHRGFGMPNRVDTRFAIASGAKGLTALAVVRLIEEAERQLTRCSAANDAADC